VAQAREPEAEHIYDPRTLASAGWINHQRVIVDRLDLRVIVEQADSFPSFARPGEPASPGARDHLRRH